MPRCRILCFHVFFLSMFPNDKEINKILKEIARIQSKLSNDAFVKNAPADIVDKEKTKIQDYEKTKSDFESQKARIQNI